jgi:uncharacterized protein (TIGR02246 family)
MPIGRLACAALVAAPLTLLPATAACAAPTGQPSTTSPATATSPTALDAAANAADEAAVRRLLDHINEAWARGDAEAYASFHTPDADLIDFRGVHARGRQEIIDLLRPAFDGVLKGTRVEARIVDLRFLTPDVAIFHTEGQIVPTGAASTQTFVATKGTDGWAIAAFQNTRIQPPQ